MWNSVSAIIGYDCGSNALNVTTISLLDIDDCDIEDEERQRVIALREKRTLLESYFSKLEITHEEMLTNPSGFEVKDLLESDYIKFRVFDHALSQFASAKVLLSLLLEKCSPDDLLETATGKLRMHDRPADVPSSTASAHSEDIVQLDQSIATDNSSADSGHPVSPALKIQSTSRTSQGAKKVQYRCSFCQGDHYVASCDTFRDLPSVARKEVVDRLYLCFNCLGKHSGSVKASESPNVEASVSAEVKANKSSSVQIASSFSVQTLEPSSVQVSEETNVKVSTSDTQASKSISVQASVSTEAHASTSTSSHASRSSSVPVSDPNIEETEDSIKDWSLMGISSSSTSRSTSSNICRVALRIDVTYTFECSSSSVQSVTAC
ncbi:uncharacterized protein DDB_G0271670-like [Diachasma alloeum]|uniref:uncharacterized protein DDB_G0271670-like n=1 Tax=Diachasma alloeum TaxID=454923 RepID=UPI00073839B1|nr:uncharacterized protein DDB_G0271670-like [Diachasma alloeum]